MPEQAPTPDVIAFDRAVEYYDQTRALTDEAMTEVVGVVSSELASRGPCLEIGVGTGRIALPLHDAGVDMTGLDVSRAMMARLVDKAGGRPPFSLVQGDARRLPFRGRSFGGVLAVHVLHLIREWEQVVSEIARVGKPRGVFLAAFADDSGSPWREITSRFRSQAGLPEGFPGAETPDEVDRAVTALGARARRLDPVVERRTYAPKEIIDRLERGLYSFTWAVDEQVRARAARAVESWAIESYGSLEAEVRSELRLEWRAYDLPG